MGREPAEDLRRVVADRLTGLGEDVVRVAVTRDATSDSVAGRIAGSRTLSEKGVLSQSTGAGSPPAAWAETPTQANPSRMSSLCVCVQSGSASSPPQTLSHSTTTVPLNFFGSIGR